MDNHNQRLSCVASVQETHSVSCPLQQPHAAICSARCETDAPPIACNRGRPAGRRDLCWLSSNYGRRYDAVELNVKSFFLLLAYPLSCKSDVVK
jgi:hypothetical protein